MDNMKTTIEIDDELFRRSKAEAALRGQSLKELFTTALREYLGETGRLYPERPPGWKSVFGVADASMVEPVDAAIAEEFGQVDPDEWK
jgi:hypothetical protein